MFTALYWVMIFEVHYLHPDLAWFAVLSAFGLSGILWIVASTRKQRDADPSWYTFAAGSFFLAAASAAVFGDAIFWSNMDKYYDLRSLNTYSSVNPVRMKGEMVMDAGRVYFADGTRIDQGKSIGFKHGDTYCVVPIASGDEKLPNYDFWAVGVNCCSSPGKFRCGADWNNFKARSALRLMDEEHRPYFRLAVQQAEAAYGITAAHPVFFHWTQDPLGDIMDHKKFGIKYFVIGTFTFFIVNFFCVVLATFHFAQMGRI